MFDSLANLGTAQTVRTSTLPLQLAAPAPALELFLEPPRERNAALDAFFYNLGNLTHDEAHGLALRYAAEGAILEVSPSATPSIEVWRGREAYGNRAGNYAALVVAGVGSSALGTAAFARDVANAAGEPVLAVVSGYGLADLVSEAMGGWFLFRALNSARHLFEWMDDLRLARDPDPAVSPTMGTILNNPMSLARLSEDVRTVLHLLSGPTRFRWLIGHSKGNLVLSEALYALEADEPAIFGEVRHATNIVTISAKVEMPRGFERIIDVMGELDNFGELNSINFPNAIETDVPVPMAWHHTNTEWPYHLPVTDTLRPIIGV
ncbi:hypothetical protein [Altererythrobacter sp. Root672]|uniref:hypothetical protein n=1 Tax=Altererythrobacter sp. Root672 TaxID=1736584 RepID=UPI000700FC9B|nr:hypothetical protein [Altererythrobacter sp. Root672]KRA82909.1 hypothetical protein ASD76_02125 [Altererythrobacter sp. Root672]